MLGADRALPVTIAACAALIVLLGCERDQAPARPRPTPPPLGASKAAFDAASTLTVRQVCERVGSANCRRMSQCSGIDADACVDTVMAECCPEPAPCAKDSGYVAGDLAACIDGFGALDCRAVKANTVPAACRRVMR